MEDQVHLLEDSMDEKDNMPGTKDSHAGEKQPAKREENSRQKISLQHLIWTGIMQRRYYYLVAVPLVISCCVYFASKSNTTVKASPTLVKAFVGCRHGSRSPIWTYGTDRYRSHDLKYWPDGAAKLTKAGKWESYELGKRLRERYSHFLDPMYRAEEVKAFTTPMDRTMMSGQLVLASLFPPRGYQLWNEDLLWQPVPLYPEYVFNTSVGAGCPRFSDEAKLGIIKGYKSFGKELDEMFEKVAKYAGEPNNNHGEVFNRVWDSTYFQVRANYELPSWLKEYYPKRMHKVAASLLTNFLIGTDVQKKLLISRYYNALRDFFYSEDGMKMEFHSWHDLNNVIILKAFSNEAYDFPEPTSCVMFELHKRKGTTFFELYYLDSYKSAEPRHIEMTCGLSCPLEDIDNFVKIYNISNYMELCNSGSGKISFPATHA